MALDMSNTGLSELDAFDDASESDTFIDEPNSVANLYRNFRPRVLPVEVQKHLDFIEIFRDGYTILGSSNLSGRYWRGSVWYFKTPSLVPSKEKCETGIECEASVCDGKFVDSRKTIIIGEDTGAVTVYKLVEEDDQTVSFERNASKLEHDSCVLSVSVSPDKTCAATAGMDMCIKVWDIAELIAAQTYRCAHSHHVTSVSYPRDDTISKSAVFASCGLDGAALLWDIRQPKPASVLIDDPKEGLTAVAWQVNDTNSLLVGSHFGNLSLVDIRVPGVITKASVFNRAVYRILPIEPRIMAACGDTHEVKIIDPLSEDFSIWCVDERHSDFVRGLAYDSSTNTLFSCGWDEKVISHSLEM